MVLKLPSVTLVAVSSVQIRRTIAALRLSAQEIAFAEILMFSHSTYSLVGKKTRQVQIDKLKSINDYNRFIIYELGNYISTSHCLLVQADGYALNPVMWSAEFLEYDYVGAAWPYRRDAYIDPFGNHQRVGNGGFSLRSRKLLTVPQHRDIPWEVNQGHFYKHMNAGLYSEDGNICVHNRHLYEDDGCKFAPVEVAVRFSQETPVPESVNITPFGFHKRKPGTTRTHRAPAHLGWWL